MRKAKPAPKIETLRSNFDQQWVTETREYEVITFLMGGGVEPYEADPITTVRAAEIKGLLRYWWRAIRGGMFNGDLDRMREREAEIWGWSGTEIEREGEKKRWGQSKVHIEVEIVDKGRFEEFDRDEQGRIRARWRWNKKKRQKELIYIRLGDPQSKFGYVAFPLRDRSGAGVRDGVRFKLHIRYPQEYRDEVEAALWAWETFGGIGARTRRGYGALRRIDKGAQYPCAAVQQQIRSRLQKYAQGKWPDNVPHLSPDMGLALKFRHNNPYQVWLQLIDALHAFRQYRTKGRFGRSLWPEPDEIRVLFGTHKRGYKLSHPMLKYLQAKDQDLFIFPRGQMGLPIIFHFKDERVGDPPKSILEGPENIRRWASRLILKPFPCREGFIGLAAVLDIEGPGLVEGTLKEIDGNRTWLVRFDQVDSGWAKTVPPLQGNPDVLQAFLRFFAGI